MHKTTLIGKLRFSQKKVLLETKDGSSYFVRGYSLRGGYVEGDIILARIVSEKKWGKLPEVAVEKLIDRSRESFLLSVEKKGKNINLSLMEGYGTLNIRKYRIQWISLEDGDIARARFEKNKIELLEKVGNLSDPKIQEDLVLLEHGIRVDFSPSVLSAAEQLPRPKFGNVQPSTHIPSWLTENLTEALTFPMVEIQYSDRNNTFSRTDFRSWLTFTIDGSDAKDLDDAISMARYTNGDFLLGVHIADVSEYVKEGEDIDLEALKRTTSIYTPNRVIPMLPEILSNDLCSLHPGEPKLTLSILMRLCGDGTVVGSFVTEGVIQSQQKWVYEAFEKELSEKYPHHAELFAILEKRRKQEGKIIFESNEPKFEYDGTTVISVEKRKRVRTHFLIEEFMVLANEEVAKWCAKKNLPFLSRIHDLPPDENQVIIREIIGYPKNAEITPKSIRDAMDTFITEASIYRHSRLLLPKMAKAFYSDKAHRHFGLALDFYAHFTSPIRRYPDLQVHRIIKEELQWTLTKERKKHYRDLLKKVAKKCSEGENTATDVERAIDAIVMCQYMSDKVGQMFSGIVSGLTEWAIFVELDNGIEVTCYLPRDEKYEVDLIHGTIARKQKIIRTIGEVVSVRIIEVNEREWRVEGGIV